MTTNARQSQEKPTLLKPPLDRGQFRYFLKRSAIFHFGILFLILFINFLTNGFKKQLTPTLRVDLVGLPQITKKDIAEVKKDIALSELEKKLDRTSEPTHETKSVTKPNEKVISLKKLSKKSNSDTESKDHESDKLKKAIDRIKALQAIENKLDAEEKKKKKSSSQFLGNQLSKGNSRSGQESEEAADAYAEAIQTKLKDNWDLPVWLSQQKLSAQAQMFLDETGYVQNCFISKSSGNAQFDDYVLKTIRKSEPFGPPPSNWVGTGIELGFPL